MLTLFDFSCNTVPKQIDLTLCKGSETLSLFFYGFQAISNRMDGDWIAAQRVY
tara:strand:+ start:476 stop:634 length:159 start_codon:yes stop_codon:yes gene_type:complete